MEVIDAGIVVFGIVEIISVSVLRNLECAGRECLAYAGHYNWVMCGAVGRIGYLAGAFGFVEYPEAGNIVAGKTPQVLVA